MAFARSTLRGPPVFLYLEQGRSSAKDLLEDAANSSGQALSF
jgi:hypothetical protein